MRVQHQQQLHTAAARNNNNQNRNNQDEISPALPRIFYHARTAVRMSGSELAAILGDPASVPDSDDDEDDFDGAEKRNRGSSEARAAWAAALRGRMSKSLSPGVRLAEREVMFNWTAFVRDRPLLVDSHVPLRAFEFCREHGQRLLLGGGGGGGGGNGASDDKTDAAAAAAAAAATTTTTTARALRRRALSLHLLTLFEHGLIDGGCMRACLAEVENAAQALARGGGEARATAGEVADSATVFATEAPPAPVAAPSNGNAAPSAAAVSLKDEDDDEGGGEQQQRQRQQKPGTAAAAAEAAMEVGEGKRALPALSAPAPAPAADPSPPSPEKAQQFRKRKGDEVRESGGSSAGGAAAPAAAAVPTAANAAAANKRPRPSNNK